MNREERAERKRKIIVLFLAAIMILSVFGAAFYGFSQPGDTVKYGTYKFYRVNNWWATKINGQQLFFSSTPPEVETYFSKDLQTMLSNKIEIDTTYDVNSSLNQSLGYTQYQLSNQLKTHNIFVRNGATTNNSFKLPVITCETATPNVPVIYFMSSNTTALHIERNCIIAQAASEYELYRLSDALSFISLGIIISSS